MKFEEYIKQLKEKYNVEEKGDGIYKIVGNERELITSEKLMYDFSYIDNFFHSTIPPVSSPCTSNVFSREILGEDDLSLRGSNFILDFSESGEFGGIGEDDLLPEISPRDLLKGKKKHVRGSVPDPSASFFSPHRNKKDDESSDENPFIKKDDISPLKGKKDPDNDHMRKPGGSGSNDFYY